MEGGGGEEVRGGRKAKGTSQFELYSLGFQFSKQRN